MHVKDPQLLVIRDGQYVLAAELFLSLLIEFCLSEANRSWPVQVQAWHDPFVSETWNSTCMLSTSPNQWQQLVHQRPSICYYVYVIMHVKDL